MSQDSFEASGVVEPGDEYRVSASSQPGAVHIGRLDLLQSLDNTDLPGQDVEMRYGLTDGPVVNCHRGEMSLELGYGDVEWNPSQSDELWVGDRDAINLLLQYTGEVIDLVIEPLEGDDGSAR